MIQPHSLGNSFSELHINHVEHVHHTLTLNFNNQQQGSDTLTPPLSTLLESVVTTVSPALP